MLLKDKTFMFDCPNLAVPAQIMQHVINVESSSNPFAIGVVGGRLARQPRTLSEAVSTAKMLEQNGYNFSLGIAQVNRYNLARYGLGSYQAAFEICPNLQAGSRILRECYNRGQDWGKAFSCYYSGNFVTGYRQGYVQKIFASMQRGQQRVAPSSSGIMVYGNSNRRRVAIQNYPTYSQSAMQSSQIVVAQAIPSSIEARYLQDPQPLGMPQPIPQAQTKNTNAPVNDDGKIDTARVMGRVEVDKRGGDQAFVY